MTAGSMANKEKLGNGVKTMKGFFCYLDDELNVTGSSEAAATSRTKIGWVKFKFRVIGIFAGF